MILQTCSTCGRWYVPVGQYYVGDIIGEICPYNGRHPETIVTSQPYYFSEEISRLKAEIDRRDEELLELNNDKAVFIKFENEDELPAEIKDDVYSAMFECSLIDGVVRLFPYIEKNGQKYFLVLLKEVE